MEPVFAGGVLEVCSVGVESRIKLDFKKHGISEPSFWDPKLETLVNADTLYDSYNP